MSILLGRTLLTRKIRARSRSIFSGPSVSPEVLVVFFALALALPAAQLRAQNSNLESSAIDKDVDSILGTMTLDEKVGQLVQCSAGQPTGPGTGRTDYADMIRKGEIGSLFNVVDPHQINQYQRIAMEKSRLHIPILFGLDVIHGFKTEFPIPLGLASTSL